MATTLDVQLNAATSTWPELRDRALAAESAGFGAVWVFDHLAGVSLHGSSMLEACTLLGALAASTSSIELGVMVANVFNRTPATLGVAAATLAAIADRRVHLGIGAGGSPTSHWSAEMHAIGQPVEEHLADRHARVEATIGVLERMWSGERSADLATFPLPRPRPDVIVGLSGPTLAALAGRRADGINVAWDDPRRDDLLAAARRARPLDRAPLIATAWAPWDEALLDPEHPERRAMAEFDVDRLLLLVPEVVSADRLATARP